MHQAHDMIFTGCDLQKEPMPSPLQDLSHSSQESCNNAGKEPALEPGKSSEGVVGAPNSNPDMKSTPEKSSVEKIQDRILPLSGKPYFTCIVCKSHIQPPYQVVVPKSFAGYLPSRPVRVSLSCKNRTWDMRFTGGRLVMKLESGWRSFAIDNNLRIGDGCILELMDSEKLIFRVQILRGEIPAKIRPRAGGYSSSSPIVID